MMQVGVMFRFGHLLILWIILQNVAYARHIQLATERSRAQSRPRLLIIRPPEGSGQPNRIVVLANSRPQPTNPSPPLSTAITALQETSAAAKAGLDRAAGGHPQSAIVHRSRSRVNSASGSSSDSSSFSSQASSSSVDAAPPSSQGGTRSLRRLLHGMRSRAHGTVGDLSRANIFRHAEVIPRAAPPVLPMTQKFGALNIPRGIEAEIRRIQEQAKRASNVRQPNIRPSHSHHASSLPTQAPPSPFHGGIIDLSQVSIQDRGQSSDTANKDAGKSSGTNPRWDIGTLRSSGTLGRNGIPSGSRNPDPDLTNSGLPAVSQTVDILQMPQSPHRHGLGMGGNTGSNLRSVQDITMDNRQGLGTPTDLNTILKGAEKSPNTFDLSNKVGIEQSSSLQSGTSQAKSSSDKATTGIKASQHVHGAVGGGHAHGHGHGHGHVHGHGHHMHHQPPPSPTPTVKSKTPTLKLNATAKLSASSAETNTTSNTTSTKSVKTKTIKVTTVVKGGTSTDVAAAAASQASIANAVAQGKPINSTDLAGLAKAAAGIAGKDSTKSNSPPVGSITVKRQPNGESIITLSDGQGEPVVLRATGPVKIERIVKPNGRIQFLINPINPPSTTAVDPGEIEPEDITTTTMASILSGSPTSSEVWPTSTPFYIDPASTGPALDSTFQPIVPVAAAVGASSLLPNSGVAQVEKTIEIKTSGSSNSQNSTSMSSTKSRTVQANTEIKSSLNGAIPSPKIPPPPKMQGNSFGNRDLFNPFIFDTNKLINRSDSNSHISTPSKNVDNKKIQLFPSDTSRHSFKTTRHADVMPQYKLLGVSPSLKVIPNDSPVP